MKTILVLHGPNLNLLGVRQPNVYGCASLENINQELKNLANEKNIKLISFQSNCEKELIEEIHKAISYDYIIFNPAAYTHTSIALRDALLAIDVPFIEVHISNIYNRDDFRKNSYFSDIAQGVISGFGNYGYTMALNAVFNYFQSLES